MNGVQFRIYQFLLKETKGTTKTMEVSEIAKKMNIKRQTVYTHLCSLHKQKLIFRGESISGGTTTLTTWWTEPIALYLTAIGLWRADQKDEAVDLNISFNQRDLRGVFTKEEMYIFMQNNIKPYGNDFL